MPIDASDINEYLQTRSDFDLELFVYRSLEERGYFASHGGTYVDPVTNKPRQFDVRATALIGKQFALCLAVECKSLSVDAPLVVSRVPRPESDSFHELIHSHVPQSIVGNVVEVIRQEGSRGIYRPFDKVGKRTAQVRRDQSGRGFKDDDRDSYEKWSQALSSADAFVQYAATTARGTDEFFTFVMPILVVSDDALWVVDYTEDGRRDGDPVKVDSAVLFVDRDFKVKTQTPQADKVIYHISHLHIFTRSGFTKFLEEVSKPGMLQDRMFGFALRRKP